MYIIRCRYHEGIESWYDYWSNDEGWTFYIELATVFKDRPLTLPILDWERSDLEVVQIQEATMTETLNDRGFDMGAFLEAIVDDDEDAITLTHPFNWLTEEEVENKEITDWILMQLSLFNIGARIAGGFHG